VRFSVEFRHQDDATLLALAEEFPRAAEAVAAENRLSLALTELFRIKAQPFDPACVSLVAEAAARHGMSAREIVSGAGHDAVYVARKVPTAMIFVPCKDGLSHNEEESILPDHAAAGAQVLCDAVLARANRRLA
jgi:N-carbamoyl-L-amino-acid hydrolase